MKWLHFIVQYSLGSFVSFSQCSRLNEFVWLLDLCLKPISASPMKFVYGWADSTWFVLRKWLFGLQIFHLQSSCPLFLSGIVQNFYIVIVYNWFYVLHAMGKCGSNRLKEILPVFAETFLLNGGLNHRIFLMLTISLMVSVCRFIC